MVRLEEWMNILQLHKQGLSISDIARRSGRDRKTIRSYLKQPCQPPKRKPITHPTKLDPFKDYLVKRWDEGVSNAVKLPGEINRQGYIGGYTTIKDSSYVHCVNRQTTRLWCALRHYLLSRPRLTRGYFGKILIQGERWRLYAFAMILGYSRMKYVEFVTRADSEHFLQGHINAFHYFGGVPEEVVVDNLKSAVTWRDKAEIHWNPRYLDFASHYGFIPQACWPYRPQTEGKVERLIGYVRKNFWPGIHYLDIADLNRQAREWLDGTANTKVNATTGESAWDRWGREQAKLMPINGVACYDTSYMTQRKVIRDCHVHYRGNRYSVPWRYAGREVVVREAVDGDLVRIYHQEQLIATHQLSQQRGETIDDRSHFVGILGYCREKAVKQQKVGILLPAGPGIGTDLMERTAPLVEVRRLSAYQFILDGGNRWPQCRIRE